MGLLNAPLSSSGPRILDAAGQPVRLAGVNWGGAHQDGLVPAGLDRLHRDQIAARIAGWGLNHVRLPFAVGSFMTPGGQLKTGPVPSPASLAANPDLAGSSPWEVYQACVAALAGAGLAVVPNQHLLYPGWCCSTDDCAGLWWNGTWPASTFTACWELLAETFADTPLVIGYDLHNEPRPASFGGSTYTPTWGDGNTQTDMRLMYADTIAQLKAFSPAKLWFCEGLQYASDLTKAGSHPVGQAGAVYSLHDYSWFHPAGQSLAAYESQMDTAGGYIQQGGQAPLWIGEFGADLGAAANMTGGWLASFLAWAQSRQVHWCWWQLSALAVAGTEPCTNKVKAVAGNREGYGLMQGQDWAGSQTDMLALLKPLM